MKVYIGSDYGQCRFSLLMSTIFEFGCEYSFISFHRNQYDVKMAQERNFETIDSYRVYQSQHQRRFAEPPEQFRHLKWTDIEVAK